MLNILLVTLLAFSYTFLTIFIGYKITLLIWRPQEILDNGKELLKKNLELVKQNENTIQNYSKLENKFKETESSSLQKDTWYMQQLQILAQYLKDKHNDNYIYDQMKHINGFNDNIVIEDDEEINEIFDVDLLLDKINNSGLSSLTKNEVEFLKNIDNDSTTNL